MQITNNYQPNFRAARIDKDAIEVLSKRLKPEELQPFINKFMKKHDSAEYDIVLGALSKDKFQLDACITYDKENFRHISEGIFSSLLRKPKSFMKKINRMMGEDVVSIGIKGRIKTTILDKLSYFLL